MEKIGTFAVRPAYGRRIPPFRGGTLLAAVVFAFGCGGSAPDDDGGAASSLTARLLEGASSAEARSVDVTRLGYDEGVGSAPIYVVEFSDFGCGYCRKFHLETLPALRKDYVETGRVRWKTIPFVTGLFSHSRQAAQVAECAARQGRFAAMAHTLFEDQPTWKPAGDPGPRFREYARDTGLEPNLFERCLGEEPGRGRIDDANRAAARLGVRGTPTFFIDGYPVQGALPLDLFRQVLESRLEAREAGKP